MSARRDGRGSTGDGVTGAGFSRRVSRRTLFRRGLLAGGGIVAGAIGTDLYGSLRAARLPIAGGYAAAADTPDIIRDAATMVTYHARTDQPVVAFTFDDGPGPRWTPMVLDVLAEQNVPATFFMVGENLAEYGHLVRGRLDRHEVGNHSWSHADLAQLTLAQVREQISRTHDVIQRVTGRQATLLRPPYGHLGGSTVLAANSLGYQIVLWSHLMRELAFEHDPAAQVRDIVQNVRPGSIVLAHDVGKDHRLVSLNGLRDMFIGLRARGFRFATVSELLALPAGSGAH